MEFFSLLFEVQHCSYLQTNGIIQARSNTTKSYSNKVSGGFLSVRAVFLHNPGIFLEGTSLSSTVCTSSEGSQEENKNVKVSLAPGGTLVTPYESWTLEYWKLSSLLCSLAQLKQKSCSGSTSTTSTAQLSQVTLWMRSTKGWVSSFFLTPSPLTWLQPSQDATKPLLSER